MFISSYLSYLVLSFLHTHTGGRISVITFSYNTYLLFHHPTHRNKRVCRLPLPGDLGMSLIVTSRTILAHRQPLTLCTHCCCNVTGVSTHAHVNKVDLAPVCNVPSTIVTGVERSAVLHSETIHKIYVFHINIGINEDSMFFVQVRVEHSRDIYLSKLVGRSTAAANILPEYHVSCCGQKIPFLETEQPWLHYSDLLLPS